MLLYLYFYTAADKVTKKNKKAIATFSLEKYG